MACTGLTRQSVLRVEMLALSSVVHSSQLDSTRLHHLVDARTHILQISPYIHVHICLFVHSVSYVREQVYCLNCCGARISEALLGSPSNSSPARPGHLTASGRLTSAFMIHVGRRRVLCLCMRSCDPHFPSRLHALTLRTLRLTCMQIRASSRQGRCCTQS